MIRNIFILLKNDLAISFKNKTIYLLIFIPALICTALRLADDNGSDMPISRIGLVRGEQYPPQLTTSLNAAEAVLVLKWIDNFDQAKLELKDKSVDGVLLQSKKTPNGLELLVYRKHSLRTIALVENLSTLQKIAEGRQDNWIAEVSSLGADGIQKESLSTWVLTILLLVGFIVIPTQVAEEKEKKLLLGLLQTPMTEGEWLAAKLLMGTVLAVASTMLLHLFGGIYDISWFSYVVFLVIGGFYFSAVGILLGFLCRTQASARALGVVFYLPHLLPAALSDFSMKMNAVAKFIPSYQFYQPIKAILLEGAEATQFPGELTFLCLAAVAACGLSHSLIRRRWLMH